MKHVFVVRHFYEDCNDTSYIGAYDDFFKAVANVTSDVHNDYNGDPKYTAHMHDIEEGDTEAWVEVMYEGQRHGTYYTITKMELQ